MTATTATTADDASRPAPDSTTLELQAQLAASLPGLPDGDLHDLVADVVDELELRVGNALRESLTEAQVAEFERFVDAGDDDGSAAWLQTNCPDYRATVMIQWAELVAEVVRTVLAADPSAATGQRGFAQVYPLSLDVVAAQLESDDVRYARLVGGDVKVGFAGSETIPEVVVRIRQPRPDTLCFLATAPGLEFGANTQPRVQAFVADWNTKTWIPKAVVQVDEETGGAALTAEVTVPLGTPVTRMAANAMMRQSLGSILGFYRAVAQRLLVSGDRGDGIER